MSVFQRYSRSKYNQKWEERFAEDVSLEFFETMGRTDILVQEYGKTDLISGG
jgi:hypothetical protein